LLLGQVQVLQGTLAQLTVIVFNPGAGSTGDISQLLSICSTLQTTSAALIGQISTIQDMVTGGMGGGTPQPTQAALAQLQATLASFTTDVSAITMATTLITSTTSGLPLPASLTNEFGAFNQAAATLQTTFGGLPKSLTVVTSQGPATITAFATSLTTLDLSFQNFVAIFNAVLSQAQQVMKGQTNPQDFASNVLTQISQPASQTQATLTTITTQLTTVTTTISTLISQNGGAGTPVGSALGPVQGVVTQIQTHVTTVSNSVTTVTTLFAVFADAPKTLTTTITSVTGTVSTFQGLATNFGPALQNATTSGNPTDVINMVTQFQTFATSLTSAASTLAGNTQGLTTQLQTVTNSGSIITTIITSGVPQQITTLQTTVTSFQTTITSMQSQVTAFTNGLPAGSQLAGLLAQFNTVLTTISATFGSVGLSLTSITNNIGLGQGNADGIWIGKELHIIVNLSLRPLESQLVYIGGPGGFFAAVDVEGLTTSHVDIVLLTNDSNGHTGSSGIAVVLNESLLSWQFCNAAVAGLAPFTSVYLNITNPSPLIPVNIGMVGILVAV
jgi:hypothetical protein